MAEVRKAEGFILLGTGLTTGVVATMQAFSDLRRQPK